MEASSKGYHKSMTAPIELRDVARKAAPACDAWTIRSVAESGERLLARQDIVQAPSRYSERGAMVSVSIAGGLAHAATSDLGKPGLREAFARARALALQVAPHMLFDPRALEPSLAASRAGGRYAGAQSDSPPRDRLSERIDLVVQACRRLSSDPRIVDWHASLWTSEAAHWSLDSDGVECAQAFRFTVPNLTAVATAQTPGGSITQTRTSGGQYNGFCQQGGSEVIARSGFLTDGARIADEAIALSLAPNCPSGKMDVVLMPDQMMLQIHESIGHPLELDRILGDERNFAGTSFVTPSMFGHYRYGSDLLNVSYDPEDRHAFASFGFDDEGTPARKEMLISKGILLRPLGAACHTPALQAKPPTFPPRPAFRLRPPAPAAGIGPLSTG